MNPAAIPDFATEGDKSLSARLLSGVLGPESAALKLTVDTTAPAAIIHATGAPLTNGVTTAQIVFSEAVTGFSQSDLSIVNGVIESVTTLDNITFLVSFRPTGTNATITITGDYADAAGNAGAKGAPLSFTSIAPQMILGNTSARTIDEDQNNSGLTIAPGVTITDADNHDFAGGSLRAHINNRVGFANVAGEVLGIRGLFDGSVFFRAVGDDIYYRQGTIIDGSGNVTTSDPNPGDDILIGSIATIGGVRLDGSKGADLQINLNENATVAITQVLASNITFSIKLTGGGLTEAWQDFVKANTSVTITLNDGQGNTSVVSKPINVVAHNDAPVAVSDVQTIGQSAADAATGNVLANDTDADNVVGLPTQQSLTVADVASGATHAIFSNHSASLQGAYGVLTMSDTGAYSYALDQTKAQVRSLASGESLVETFDYNVSDGAAQASSTLTITINGTNVAPVAIADQDFVSSAGGPASGNVLTNDTDANGHLLHVTGVPAGAEGATFTGEYGTLTLNADGAYTYTPDAANETVQALAGEATVTDSFTYSISDGHGGTASSTLAITLSGSVVQNEAPTGNPEWAIGTPYADITGNVLQNDYDPEAQTLTVTGAAADENVMTVVALIDVTVTGRYGALKISADGHYVYTPDASAVRVDIPLFGTAVDRFNYALSDGHGGSSAATLEVDVINSPIVIMAGEGTYTVYDTVGGVKTAINTFFIPEANTSAVWIPPETYKPGNGSHVLSVSGGATISVFGGTASSTARLEILDVAHLPETAADSTLYIVHDTRAHLSNPALLTNHAVMGFIVNGGEAADGGYETVTDAHIPVIGYDAKISLPTSARTLDEDANNTGLLVAYNGFGLNIFEGSADTGKVGFDIGHAAVGAGSVLTAQINNLLTGTGGVAGEILYVRTSSALFRVERDGSIYYRQDTEVAGGEFVFNGVTYKADDPIVVDATAADDLLIGHLRPDGSGNLLDGRHNRALSIELTGLATQDIVELLAGHIGFGVHLNDGSNTEAWGAFASADPAPSVTMTLTGPGASDYPGSATRDITLVAHNDAPLAHNDMAAIGKGAGTYTGWVLGNDDPDILPNKGFGHATLPAGLSVTDVVYGGSTHLTFGTEFTSAYGTMTFNADGTYTYVLKSGNAAVSTLTATSAPLLDVFHYTMTDGSGVTSSADLKIMIDGLSSHWGREDKTPSSSTPASDTVYKHAVSAETQYVFGFDMSDTLGAVGPGTVKIDGGAGDDVMFALANYTSLKGGSGADKFVVASADIHVRIDDMDIVADNNMTDVTKDILDLSQLFGGMTSAQIDSFVSSHITETTDAATGKVATVINFDGLKGVSHTGDLTIVGLTNAQADNNMQAGAGPLALVNYTLLDELRLIASNHG